MGAKIKIETSLLNGRRVGHIVDQIILDSEATVQEAIDYGFVTGKQTLIENVAKGVLRSMADGVKKDGNGRKIDDLISLQAFARGRVDDITDDFDAGNIEVSVKAWALSGLQVDWSDWSFQVSGTTSGDLSITSVSTGEDTDVVYSNEAIEINGFGMVDDSATTQVFFNMPSCSKSGEIPQAKITECSATRIVLASDVLSEIHAQGNDGKPVIFTVKLGTKQAARTAEYHYVA